jgi:hypothetical protein
VPPVVDPAESIRAAVDEAAEAGGTTAPDAAAGKTGEKT